MHQLVHKYGLLALDMLCSGSKQTLTSLLTEANDISENMVAGDTLRTLYMFTEKQTYECKEEDPKWTV